MAAIAGESPPEESPEVPEPDLSMELQDQLRRSLIEHESGCAKEEAQARRSEPRDPGGGTGAEADAVREKYAEAAVIELVTILKSFDPEISKEKLSNDIFSILHSDAVVAHLNPQLKADLRKYVPRDRKEWLAEDIERHITAKRAQLRILRRKLGKALSAFRSRTLTLARDPAARVVLLSAGSSAAVLGACGGVVGLAGGTMAGTLVGVPPALLTFGLSIPAGAVAGGGLGACVGVLAGATMGLIGGGAAGSVTYVFRVEMKDGVAHVRRTAITSVASARTKALETTNYLKVSAMDAVDTARAHAASTAQHAIEAASDVGVAAARAAQQTRVKASALRAGTVGTLRDRGFQAGAVSAAGGAVAVGAGGGAAGLAAGSFLGAACGVVPALFTFGLSIPVGAALGGGAGLCMGAVAGSTAGFVGGGAAGYSAYARRAELRSGVRSARARVDELAERVRERATSSASYVKTKLVGDRGGTE